MSLSNCYVTLEEIRHRLGGQVSADQSGPLETAITSASRAIDLYCGQQFYDSGSVSARTFTPKHRYRLKTDPFSTVTGLIVKTDTADDASFATTWVAADYEVDYFGGDFGQTIGAPFDTIRAIRSNTWPTANLRVRSVQVTARWGWGAVPQSIAEAARILSVDLWGRKDIRHGVMPGTLDGPALRVGRDMMAGVADKLDPFVRQDRQVGIG